jgi:hypothetical protein
VYVLLHVDDVAACFMFASVAVVALVLFSKRSALVLLGLIHGNA